MAELVSHFANRMGECQVNSDLCDDPTDQNSQDDQDDNSARDPAYYEERFRVDRRKLEQMLQVASEDCSNEQAEEFFHKIMEDTNTHITWPSKLKIGAKSKKDPHIKVGGKREAVSDAKERIMTVLDTKSTRVTLKMDVSHTEHSHVIGKGGNNIKRVMQETDCHIHFPDSNRNNQVEKSNQVSIAGQPHGVEQARVQIRDLLPLVFMFDLPIAGMMQTIPDSSSPTVQQIQNSYGICVTFKQYPKLYKTTVIVRGCVANAKSVKEATALLLEHLAGSLAASLPVSLQLEIAAQHHLFIIGRGGANIKQIMQRTGANILFPDPNAVQPQRKGTVYITGSIESVFVARQHLIGCLPLVLMFDMKDESDIEQSELTLLMDRLDVFISVKPKPKQPSKSVIVKSIERNAPSLFRARRRLLGLTIDPPPGLPCCSLDAETNLANNNNLGLSALGLLGHNVLNANPLLMLNGSGGAGAGNAAPLMSPSPRPDPYACNSLVVLAPPTGSSYGQHSPVRVFNQGAQISPPKGSSGDLHVVKPLSCLKKQAAVLSDTPDNVPVSVVSTTASNVQQSPKTWYSNNTSSPGSSTLDLITDCNQLSSALSDTALNLCAPPLCDTEHLQTLNTASSLMDVVLPRRTSSPTLDLFGFPGSNAPLNASCPPGYGSPLGSSMGSAVTSTGSPIIKRQTVYLNDSLRGASFQNGEHRSSESGCDSDSSETKDILINSTASALFGGNSFFSEFDSEQKNLADYDKKKLLADKAMQKKPEGESRTPTDMWSGLGFSKSMPDSAIRDRLRQAGSRYKGPTMTTTYENGELETEPWQINNTDCSAMDGLSSTPTLSHMSISAAPGEYPSPRRKIIDGEYPLRGNGDMTTQSVMCRQKDWQHSKTDGDRLAGLFNTLGLCKYTDLFQQQEIDIPTFLTLTDQDLRELGIATFGARKKMLLAISDLGKRQTLMSAAPGDNNPFRNSGTGNKPSGRRHDIASQSGRW